MFNSSDPADGQRAYRRCHRCLKSYIRTFSQIVGKRLALVRLYGCPLVEVFDMARGLFAKLFFQLPDGKLTHTFTERRVELQSLERMADRQ